MIWMKLACSIRTQTPDFRMICPLYSDVRHMWNYLSQVLQTCKYILKLMQDMSVILRIP
jgi:hypothetical protein